MEAAENYVCASNNQLCPRNNIKPLINGIRRPLSQKPPRFTSALSPWEGFVFEDVEVPVRHLSKISYDKSMLFLFTHGTAHFWMSCNGARYERRVKAGQLFIMRAGQETRGAHRSNACRMIQVELDTGKIQSLSEAYGRAVNHLLVPQLITRDSQIACIIRTMKAEVEAGCPSGDILAESISIALLCCVVSRYSYARKLEYEHIRKFDSKTQSRIEEYIHYNLSTGISVRDLSELVNVRPMLFSQMFLATFGMTPYRYLLKMRLERAKVDLILSERKVTDIAKDWGFANQSHFSSAFRHVTGLTPTQFRRECR